MHTRFLKSEGCGTPAATPPTHLVQPFLSLSWVVFSRYSSLPLWEIQKIPVRELASNKALVVVWVTNKQKYRKFVIEELFPDWSCKFIGEWYWVKVIQNVFCLNIESKVKTRSFFLLAKLDVMDWVLCFLFLMETFCQNAWLHY